MEEPVAQKAQIDIEPEIHRRRRRTKHHHLHLHRAQRRLLGQAAVFAAFVLLMLIVWYWIVVKR
ncbi:MAG: hypothetical protein ROO76_19165 [Terriglobia bacterium]|jgi:hypothetical protein|nr:hypothetical protein [Terriglobia bacterium]